MKESERRTIQRWNVGTFLFNKLLMEIFFDSVTALDFKPISF